jgi:hypothetical protein
VLHARGAVPTPQVAPEVAPDSVGFILVAPFRSVSVGHSSWRIRRRCATGDRAGDPNHELASVVDAARLPDDRVVIALGGREQQLRYYNEKGDFLHATARSGGGPGEFMSIRAIVPLNEMARLSAASSRRAQ